MRGRGLPRRDGVILIARPKPDAPTWAAAIAVGAQHVCGLPEQERELVADLADAAESAQREVRAAGRMVAVIGGRGGAGASMFAVALAQSRRPTRCWWTSIRGAAASICCSAAKSTPGLRWPDLASAERAAELVRGA